MEIKVQKVNKKEDLIMKENSSYNNNLVLTLKKQWFDMILSGEKKEEYREKKPYWEKRFINYFGRYRDTPVTYLWNGVKKNIVFKNGYQKDAPQFTAECSIHERYGHKEWGAEEDKIYYVLEIHKIFNIKNVQK